ncbi:MAG: hypothetical protein KME15_05860 [Drouetiella hepatica Uher 2000/2452]|jgi:hypothetical protein|uniref:Uncharacterized protein n=1 Tax=Drouetiella hepatica Uher 2000/2452 TaxID=904376 RepID=A0A951QAC9_9CYAN|nr:hypothetical protein [Drouetiella hepatica Uher 2000/2452]
MDTERDRTRLKFPLWKYLTQPLFSPEFKSLNPRRFWHLYNAEQLKVCWERHISEPVWVENPVQFLEICWLKTGVGIKLVQSLQVVEFLERCWNKEFLQNPLSDRHGDTPEYFDESEDYY